jgi:uncharacterized protein
MINVKKRFSILFLITMFMIVISVSAQQESYHLKLLAVQQINDSYKGSTADLFLELREGTGRIFLDTYPLTKLDTQISARFAKDVACNHFKLNCNKYDFIYTIKSESNIIGGPSAGAAMGALTTIAMLDLDYNEDIAITGTINSGAIIGPVGGVKEKLEAAAETGIKKVLIAKGTAIQKVSDDQSELNISNNEIDLIAYSQNNLSLDVFEVMDLDEIIFHLTGKKINKKETNISEDLHYKEIMQLLQETLCNRTEKIEQEIKERDITFNENITQEIKKRKENFLTAKNNEDYYSAASFCFSNNIYIKSNYYQEKEISELALNKSIIELISNVDNLKKQLNTEKIETISDLQTLIVVKERINDVEEQIKEYYNSENLEDKRALLAYAEERLYSALSWQQFFAMNGKKFTLSQERLQESCQKKISEAEERHQYASTFIGELPVMGIQEKLSIAKEKRNTKEYGLCLIKASQAKAESNAVLSSLGINEDNFAELLESKSIAVERVISDNIAEDIFPILGYSYYQYANSLKENEQYTALVYFEYALEISNLEIYFPAENGYFPEFSNNLRINNKWIYFTVGIISGVIFTLILIGLITYSVLYLKRKK